MINEIQPKIKFQNIVQCPFNIQHVFYIEGTPPKGPPSLSQSSSQSDGSVSHAPTLEKENKHTTHNKVGE